MSDLPLNFAEDAIQFSNLATRVGLLNGTLTIGHDRRRNDLRAYALHWGKNATEKTGATSKLHDYSPENTSTGPVPRYVYNQPLIHRFNNTPAPAAATHLLVFVTDTQGREFLYASRPLLDRQHLLPPSATQLERHLAALSSRLSRIPVQLDTLWDPSRCPDGLLPWLAWANSGDIWYDNADDPVDEASRRRQLIRRSGFVHQHKGTRAAIQQALDAFANASITMTEWWEQQPRGYPHTFRLDLLVNGSTPGAGTAEFNKRLRRAIDVVKPVRSHFTITVSTVQTATLTMAPNIERVSYKRFAMAAAF